MVITTVCIGQTLRSQSNAEKFFEKTGTLIQREFFEIGALKDVDFKVIHYTDLISKEKVCGLQLEIQVSSESNDIKFGILDADEVDGLIKAILIMKSTVFTRIPSNYEEAVFKSRGGFSLSCFWNKNKWSSIMQIEEFDIDSFVFLEVSDYDVFLGILNKAVPLLKL